MLTDLQLIHAAFDLWLHEDGTDNLVDINRAKRMLPIVLDECVTVVQRDYIIKYYIDGMNCSEIAELYRIDKSTVSRTIRRGIKNAYGYLRFVSPLFVKAPKPRGYITNNRKRSRKENRNGLDTP